MKFRCSVGNDSRWHTEGETKGGSYWAVGRETFGEALFSPNALEKLSEESGLLSNVCGNVGKGPKALLLSQTSALFLKATSH